MNKLYVIFLALFFTLNANASEEGIISFNKFSIESSTLKSGLVSVEGMKGSSGKYEKIVIHAFGKIFSVPEEILSTLPADRINGVQLSGEGGYEILGGETIYIQFQVGFTSEVSNKFIISVNERGDIEVLSNKKP
jgi:hypothetical protein